MLKLLKQLIGTAPRLLPAPVVPEVRVELLRLAGALETSQPGYAAGLRAAALRPMARG